MAHNLPGITNKAATHHQNRLIKHTHMPPEKTNAAITPMASSANEIRSPKVINFKPMLADAMTEQGIPEC